MGKLLDYNKQLDNHGALRDFWQSNELKVKNNRVIFTAIINYYLGNILNVSDTANVRISLHSADNGSIEIEDTEEISSEKLHTGFNCLFQQYRFNDLTGAIEITDTSPKIGKYKVEIIPIGK